MTAPTAPLTQLSDDETMFRQAVRDFAEAEVAPLVHAMDAKAQFDRSLLPKFGELGLFGIDVPERFGGAGGTFFMSVLAVEELARVDASTSVLVDVHNTLAIVAVQQFGSEAVQAKYLPRLAAGEVGAYALSEANSGSDAFALECRAEQRGGGWVLNGQKLWITNGNEADLFIVFANVDPSRGYKGITGFMIERGTTGFTVGKKEDKLGLRASSTT
jgi:alkylation response protein AidB-like acyl-CoA dehydrogenase